MPPQLWSVTARPPGGRLQKVELKDTAGDAAVSRRSQTREAPSAPGGVNVSGRALLSRVAVPSALQIYGCTGLRPRQIRTCYSPASTRLIFPAIFPSSAVLLSSPGPALPLTC
ncbi:hypothetical protein AAFF_G00167310 [Aldrovandia affinis]|uniref:Uncharacterized protein n=1 Tax=Aldrovandia affinis TaxID=143900 RepID=A0AAD7RMQ0_9TELE|nr:hypothetical protein AAFF_G00167310 [Aldrovandia affinis]